MLTAEEKGRVVVVLAGARNPLNIGAAARAMSNFGFTEMRIVTEYPLPFREAKSAVDAVDVVRKAGEFVEFGDAVMDCGMVIGTTAVGDRKLEQAVNVLPAVAVKLKEAVVRGERVAIVFGSEKNGMSNEQLSYCTELMTIPMEVHGTSMNLGQSVAVCLWEMVRGEQVLGTGYEVLGGDEARVESSIPPIRDEAAYGWGTQSSEMVQEKLLAESGEVERMVELLREVFRETEYERRFPGNCGDEMVRRLARRMGMSRKDAETWMGVLRQVLWKVKKL